MTPGIYVTVSRLWNNPTITTVINDECISLTLPLEDFIAALKQEVGSVTWTLKNKTFQAQLDAAVERVIEGIKKESIKVVG